MYWYIIGSVTCSTNPDRRVADRTSSGVRRGDRRLNTDGLPDHAVKRKMDLPFSNSYSFALNTIAITDRPANDFGVEDLHLTSFNYRIHLLWIIYNTLSYLLHELLLLPSLTFFL